MQPADLIDYAFRTGNKPGEYKTALKPEQSVGFKWRAWGGEESLRPIIAHHQPVLFHLFRRDLVDYAASYYMSNHIVPEIPEAQELGFTKGGHSQFKFKDLPNDKREHLRQAIDRVEFSIPVNFAIERIQKVTDAKIRIEDSYLSPLEKEGVKIRHISYEDYLSDPKDLLRKICRTISVDENFDMKTQFKKVSSKDLLTQVQNIDELMSNDKIKDIIVRSEALFNSRAGI